MSKIKLGQPAPVLITAPEQIKLLQLLTFLLLIYLGFRFGARAKNSGPSSTGGLIGLVIGFLLMVMFTNQLSIRVAGPTEAIQQLGMTLTQGVAGTIVQAVATPTPPLAFEGNGLSGISSRANSGGSALLRVQTPVPPGAATATALVNQALAGSNPALLRNNAPLPQVTQATGTRLLGGILDPAWIVVAFILLIILLAGLSLNPKK